MSKKHLTFATLALTALSLPLCADLKIDIYGYVKLDLEYNTTNTGSLPSPAPTAVPLNSDKQDSHGEFIIDARESRFGVRATDQFNTVKMLGVVEADFFTADGDALVNNSRHLRLRMAYGRADMPYGLFMMAGQFWSTWMNDTIGQPNLIDFNGPVGAPYARQPQLRVGYEKQVSESAGAFLVQAAIEKQAVSIANEADEVFINANSLADPSQGSGFRLPLGVFKLSWLQKYFQMEVAGCCAPTTTVLKKFTNGRQTDKLAWGVQSSAQFNYKKFTAYGTLHRLVGLSRLDGGNFFDGVIKNDHFSPVHSTGWYAGGSWAFTPQLSFNAVFGWDRAKQIPNSPFSGTVYGRFTSIHTNLIYTFWKRWQTGIEFERFDCRTFNNQLGHVNIFHSAIYLFF